MGRPKDLGTRRETWFVRKAEEAGLRAWRASNNAASEDVLVHTAGQDVIHEVKDREALSLHPLMKKITGLHGYKAAVVGHRKKKAGATRVPAGPTLVAITVERYLELLAIEDRGNE